MQPRKIFGVSFNFIVFDREQSVIGICSTNISFFLYLGSPLAIAIYVVGFFFGLFCLSFVVFGWWPARLRRGRDEAAEAPEAPKDPEVPTEDLLGPLEAPLEPTRA